jgi:hypothetical protein
MDALLRRKDAPWQTLIDFEECFHKGKNEIR